MIHFYPLRTYNNVLYVISLYPSAYSPTYVSLNSVCFLDNVQPGELPPTLDLPFGSDWSLSSYHKPCPTTSQRVTLLCGHLGSPRCILFGLCTCSYHAHTSGMLFFLKALEVFAAVSSVLAAVLQRTWFCTIIQVPSSLSNSALRFSSLGQTSQSLPRMLLLFPQKGPRKLSGLAFLYKCMVQKIRPWFETISSSSHSLLLSTLSIPWPSARREENHSPAFCVFLFPAQDFWLDGLSDYFWGRQLFLLLKIRRVGVLACPSVCPEKHTGEGSVPSDHTQVSMWGATLSTHISKRSSGTTVWLPADTHLLFIRTANIHQPPTMSLHVVLCSRGTVVNKGGKFQGSRALSVSVSGVPLLSAVCLPVSRSTSSTASVSFSLCYLFFSQQPLNCHFDSSFLSQDISLCNCLNRTVSIPSGYLLPFPDQSKERCFPTPFTFAFKGKTGLYL